MRIFITLVCITAFGFTMVAQNLDKFYKWDVSVSYALQEHDKRLYDWPAIPKQEILEKQPERWGTHWYKIALHRNILESKNFKLKAGVGFATEYKTFHRPFDHCLWFPSWFCPDMIMWTDGYKIHNINIPIEYNYYIINGLSVNATLEGNFSFFRSLRSKRWLFGESNRWKRYEFQLYSISLFPGISYDFGRLLLKADYRAFQLKNIDDVIFFHSLFGTTPDPREDGVFETYNPAHFRITLSYEFGEREFEEEKK
jgi:hypothetical protein